MKKLMVMLASAAAAFGLFAEETASPAVPNGTTFEGVTTDTELTASDLNAKEPAGTLATWAWTESSDTTVKVVSEVHPVTAGRPTQWADAEGNNYLSVKTPFTSSVARTITNEISAVNGLYVDTLVKFTAADEAISVSDASAKIAVWVREYSKENGDDIDSTNLIVTAGKYEGTELSAEKVDYDCGKISDLDAWHRLTIKTVNGVGAKGFVVYLDKEAVVCADAKTAFGTATLNANAEEFRKAGKLFPTMQSYSGLTAIAMAGQGSIDDISFTQTAPDFAVDYQFFTVVGSDKNVASFKVGDVTWNSGEAEKSVVYLSGSTYTATEITYAEGYFGDSTQDLTVSAGAAVKVGTAKKIAVKVGDTNYASLTDAIAAEKGKDFTITLNDAVKESVTIENTDHTTVLDLAGKTLTGLVTYKTPLTITDTVGNGSMTNETADCVVYMDDIFRAEDYAGTFPMLTISAGTFDGSIDAIDAANMTVTGGKFASDDEPFPYASTNPWTVGEKEYKADKDGGYWTVTEVTTVKASFTAGEHFTVKTVNGETYTAGTTITVDKGDVTVVYEADSGYYFAGSTTEMTKTFTVAAGVNAAPAEVTVFFAVAEIGAAKYATLAAAVAAVKDGETIKVIADTYEADQVALTGAGKSDLAFTIENNANVTFSPKKDQYSFVLNGATMTLTGTGSWLKPVSDGGASMFKCGADSDVAVIIQSGTFVGGTNGMVASDAPSNLIQMKGGSLTVNDGTFVNYRYDQARCIRTASATASITVNGGTFECRADDVGKDKKTGRLNPIDKDVDEKSGEYLGTITIPAKSTAKVKAHKENITLMSGYCATGYGFVADGEDGWYSVKAVAANVDYVNYETLADALVAAEASATVTILKDLTVAATDVAKITKDITIDANNFVVTLADETMSVTNNLTLTCTGATQDHGFKNLAQITVAAGKTLDLSTLSWYAGLVGTTGAEKTAWFYLAEGATYKQKNDASWSDTLTNIFSVADGSGCVIKVTSTDDPAIITAEKAVVPVPPEEKQSYDTKAEAEAAAAKAEVSVPAEITDTDQAITYKSYFEATTPVYNETTGKYEFSMVLKDEIEKEIGGDIETGVEAIDLSKAASGQSQEVSVDTKVGIWYNFKQGTSVKALSGTAFMGDGSAKTFAPENKGTAGFYTIKAGVKQADVQ